MEKNSPTVLLAAIYIRVSTLEQAEDGYSLAAQERTLRDYCKIKGYEVYDIYADEGRSGKDIRGRPEMQRLVKDGIDEKFDIVLVWKLTRFTRTLSDLCATCNILEKHGAYLESYSEAFDSKTTVGRLIRGILGAVAQWEREVIAENVIAAMEERARQGKRTCNEVLGYDLDGSDSLIINAQEAEVVQYIFDRYLEYRNLSAVAELCRLKGYRGKRGRVFNAWSIRLILTRPIYAGYNSYNGKIFFGQHEPIIPVKVYNRVQHILSNNPCGRACVSRQPNPIPQKKA